MRIPINFHSAELLVQSLCLSITDSVSEAGCDAEVTVERLYQAGAFAHELARLLDNLGKAVAGQIVIEDDTEDHGELRAAMAAAKTNVTPLRSTYPTIRVDGGDVA